ncbi:hypothetical protein GCM10023338_07120 [Wohlfahrtiimonas larvae]|uniref:Peptidase M48 domain-containing protein n=1 Tax=Wohlfahrtiimonas larvae TaxID=1157986 RepID=A0ABP9MHP8_9GAMM
MIYAITSIVMGLFLAWATPVELWVWVIICNAFMLLMVWTKFMEMREGVDYVMQKLGAIEINQFNQNPIVARYMQVVIEMSIAAGIVSPRLFILPSYDINAFAIAKGQKDTAIAVTEGAISRLTRSELQALVGHEISHILHQDPVLNFKLIGWLYGLQSIYLYGYTMFSFFTRHFLGDFDRVNRFCLGYSMRTIGAGSREFGDGNGLFPIFLMMIMSPVIVLSLMIMCVGAVGAIFARSVKALISRQREYLADAESVRFVRGHYIVQVLEKIALLEGDEEQYNTTSMDATHQEFSHFYIQNYQEKTSIFDTHPPILKRIRKIQPTYRFPSGKMVNILDQKFVDKSESTDEILVSALHDYAKSRINNVSHNIVIELGLDKNSEHVFMQLAKSYATFITTHNLEIRQQQLDYLYSVLSSHLFNFVNREAEHLRKMSDFQRLQLLTHELPRMDHLAKFQIQEIENICQALVDMDQKISLSEYCMILVVRVHISKIGREGSIDYSTHFQSIQVLEKPLAKLLSATTVIIFRHNAQSAQRCYDDIAEFLNISQPFDGNLCWQSVFDETLPMMKELSVSEQSKIKEVLFQLSNMPKLNSDAQCLLFILQRAFNLLY